MGATASAPSPAPAPSTKSRINNADRCYIAAACAWFTQ